MPDQQRPEPQGKIVVPGRPLRTQHIETDPEYEGLVDPADLGSASRSCLAIIIVLLVIAGLICVFLVATTFFR